jgi:hypothetical protein
MTTEQPIITMIHFWKVLSGWLSINAPMSTIEAWVFSTRSAVPRVNFAPHSI